MLERANTVLNSISEIAAHLNAKKLYNVIEDAKSGMMSSEKLQLTIIGQHFNELPEILAGLLEKPHMFTKSFGKMTRSFSLKAVFSESEHYKISTKSSESFSVTKEVFEKHFSRHGPDSSVLLGEVHTNVPILKVTDINLICSAEDFEDFDWMPVLSRSDYLVVVLKADTLLSISEKRYIKDVVHAYFDTDRCALLLNNFDRIPEADREEVTDYFKSFLSSLGPGITYYKYSACLVLENQTHGQTVNEDYTGFINMVRSELTNKVIELREGAIIQTVKNCITELKETIKLYNEELKSGRNKINEVIESLSHKDKHMNRCMVNIDRKIEMFINGLVKSRFISKIDDFNEVLKQEIKNDVIACNDISEIKKNMSAYLEYIWERFFSENEVWLKNVIFVEMSDIYRIIEKDMEDYLKEIEPDMGNLIAQYTGNKFNLRVLAHHEHEKDPISRLTQYMNLGAIGLAFISFPWALVTFGAAQILHFAFKDSIKQSEKEALANSAAEACDKLKTKIVKQVDVRLSDMTAGLKAQVRKVYNDALNSIIITLEDQKRKMDNSDDLIRYLDVVENNTIPQLMIFQGE